MQTVGINAGERVHRLVDVFEQTDSARLSLMYFEVCVGRFEQVVRSNSKWSEDTTPTHCGLMTFFINFLYPSLSRMQWVWLWIKPSR